MMNRVVRPCYATARLEERSLIDEDPERLVPLAPIIRRFGQNILECCPVARMRLAIVGGMRNRNHAAGFAEPVFVLEAVRERVPVAAEMIRQRETLRQRSEHVAFP